MFNRHVSMHSQVLIDGAVSSDAQQPCLPPPATNATPGCPVCPTSGGGWSNVKCRCVYNGQRPGHVTAT